MPRLRPIARLAVGPAPWHEEVDRVMGVDHPNPNPSPSPNPNPNRVYPLTLKRPATPSPRTMLVKACETDVYPRCSPLGSSASVCMPGGAQVGDHRWVSTGG